MRIETVAVHAGNEIDPSTGAVAPPIHLSTTFARDEGSVPLGGHTYTRESNPTQDALESALARLEGGSSALVFASGMAASAALLQSLPKGSHVLVPDDAYYGVRAAALDFFEGWGLTFSFVPTEDLAAVEREIRPETKLLWLETPSNPLLKVSDLAGAVALARRAGALTVADNTFATPVLQRPFELGVDFVIHSTTKYFGGHSDVQGGALIFREAGGMREKAFHVRHILGAVASPFGSWLVRRGIRSLPCRIAAHCAGAMAVARALEGHLAVSAVHYPGLPSHPGHAVAARQMSAFGGMLSFQVKAGREEALRIVGRVRLFTRATSLGGTESLIEHRASSEGPMSTTPQDLIRLSIGLESPEDLIEDLRRALS